MQLGHIELGKLAISPANMRRYGRNPDLANILPTVRSRGVIQPLLVRPKGEGYEVVAGGRRYLSRSWPQSAAGSSLCPAPSWNRAMTQRRSKPR